MTTLAVIFGFTVDCILCYPVPRPILPDARDFSSSISLPLKNAIGCKTDFFAMKKITALHREVDKIERLRTQVEEKENDVSRFQHFLNLLRIRYERFSKDIDSLTCSVRKSTSRLEELQENKQLTKTNDIALHCIYAILQSFADTKFDHFTAADCLQHSRSPWNCHTDRTSSAIITDTTFHPPRSKPCLPKENSNDVNWYQRHSVRTEE